MFHKLGFDYSSYFIFSSRDDNFCKPWFWFTGGFVCEKILWGGFGWAPNIPACCTGCWPSTVVWDWGPNGRLRFVNDGVGVVWLNCPGTCSPWVTVIEGWLKLMLVIVWPKAGVWPPKIPVYCCWKGCWAPWGWLAARGLIGWVEKGARVSATAPKLVCRFKLGVDRLFVTAPNIFLACDWAWLDLNYFIIWSYLIRNKWIII